MRCFLSLFVFVVFVLRSQADDAFEKAVRPILVERCLACHGAEQHKGGLRLDSKAGWQTGGDSGPAIKPGKPADSLLIKALHGQDGLAQMPPKAKLTEREINILTRWIADGANDPRTGGPQRLGGTTIDAAKKWWSFQPVRRPTVPPSAFSNPIDAFISAKLAEKKLQLSPVADKRTLLRRVTFDLTGLPPTPAELAAFVNDRSPEAFANVIDRLLASPHYGERWGRHWLDLVRYADTAGENSDHPLPHMWRYRNWVINAFNRDQPFHEFIRDQIAGDLVGKHGPPEQFAERLIATGYLAVARRFDHDSDTSMHLTHEDGIDTLGKAFMGLTLGCARCHDHKYDAITARDYYALYGIFESTKFSFAGCEAKQQPRDLLPLLPPAEWNRVVKPYQDRIAKLDSDLRTNRDGQLNVARRIQAELSKHRTVLSTGEIADAGDQTFRTEQEVSVNAGELLLLSITPLKNHGADTTQIEFEITETNGQKRTWNATADLLNDLLNGNPHADRHGNAQTWWLLDTRNQPLPLAEAVRDVTGKPGIHAWRNGDTPSVLVNTNNTEVTTWTKLPAKALFAHPAANGNVAIGWLSPITGKVTIKGRVKDAHPTGPDGVGWVLEHFRVDLNKAFSELATHTTNIRELAKQHAALLAAAPKQEVAFAVTEGKPADARLHLRGDPEKLGDVVPRRWLEVFGGTPLKNHAESGRLELANWLTSAENPLTARVFVNRVWLQHFGKGIVPTPNDFGTRGTPPTHPELLDWLASEFVQSGWSIKKLHRTILLSATYQQQSSMKESAAAIDPTNQHYWRFDRRRLTAEELRDSLLVASGKLDRTPAEAHPFPPTSAWSYTQHVPFSTFFETDKRSVYLVNVRNRRHPFLGLFDGADPNATTPQRQTTTVPTQALYFLNDPFFHAQAEQLANQLLQKPEAERTAELFRITLQRDATSQDIAKINQFIERYQPTLTMVPTADRPKATWSALARIVLASNEFLFVE